MVPTATSRTTAGFAMSGLGRVAVHTTVGMLLCKERKLGLVVVGAAQVCLGQKAGFLAMAG